MLAVAGLSIFSKPESRSTYDGRPYVVGAPRLAPATVQQLAEIHVNSRTDGCQWTKLFSIFLSVLTYPRSSPKAQAPLPRAGRLLLLPLN